MYCTSSGGRVVARQLCMPALSRTRRGHWFFHRLSALDARWRTPRRPPAAHRPVPSHARIASSLTSDGQPTTPAFDILARDRPQLAVVGCRFDGPKSTPRAGADASEISPPTEGVPDLLLLLRATRSAELGHYVEFVPSGQQTRVLVALRNQCVARKRAYFALPGEFVRTNRSGLYAKCHQACTRP